MSVIIKASFKFCTKYVSHAGDQQTTRARISCFPFDYGLLLFFSSQQHFLPWPGDEEEGQVFLANRFG